MTTAQRLTFLAAMLQVPVAPVVLRGQAAMQADSGSRVRVTVDRPSKHSRVGSLISMDADSLRFTSTDGNGIVATPIASVTRLERSRGRRSNAGRGALIGGIVGGAAGLILGIAAADEGGWFPVGPKEIALVTGFMGATFAGLGALVGAASKSERWEPVTVPGKVVQQTFHGRSIAKAQVTIVF